jgi:hypothetical protein
MTRMSWSPPEGTNVHILSDNDPIFDNPTGAVLTVGAVAKLSSAAAHAEASLAKIYGQLATLRADLDAMKAHRTNEELAKAASVSFRAQQR